MTAAVIVVLVILFIILFIKWADAPSDDYLYGFWTADDTEFCERSDIESMMVFIGEPETSLLTTTRECYLIIMNDLYTGRFTMSYKKLLPCMRAGPYELRATVAFDDEEAPWPDEVTICANMLNGTIKIYADDTLYASLTKQHETTNIAARATKQEAAAD